MLVLVLKRAFEWGLKCCCLE